MNIIFIAQWLFSGKSESLYCSDVVASRQKLFKPDNIFEQTCVYFLLQKYDIISQLCHCYAKGPFCVVRLKLFWRDAVQTHHHEQLGDLGP